jgi:hypothetical protein
MSRLMIDVLNNIIVIPNATGLLLSLLLSLLLFLKVGDLRGPGLVMT